MSKFMVTSGNLNSSHHHGARGPVTKGRSSRSGSARKTIRGRAVALSAAVSSLAMMFVPSVKAASETWVGGATTDGMWSTTANWSASTVPGLNPGTTSADIATFNTSIANTWGAVGTPIVIDSGRNIGGINFDTATDNYYLGTTAGSPLLLSGGGTIQILSTLTSTNAVETVNAPLVIEGAAGTYTFANNSANGTGAGAGTLNFGGGITGGAAGATVLTLSGSNTNANTISGIIANGSSTSLSVVKSGAGTWIIGGSSSPTYTGPTVVNGGTLGFTNVLTNSTTFSGTGTVSFNVSTATTLLPTTAVFGSSFTGQINLNTNGVTPSVFTNTTSFGSNLGSLNISAGSLLSINASTMQFDALTGSGTIQNTAGSSNLATLKLGANNGGGLFTGSLNTKTSGQANLNIIKLGSGTQTFAGATSSYGGTTTIQAGTLVAGANAPSNANGSFGKATTAIILGNGSTLAGDAPTLLINGAFTVGRTITVGSVADAGVAYNATIGGSNATGTSVYTGAITLSTAANSYTATLVAASGGTTDFNNTWTTNNKPLNIGSSGSTGTVEIDQALATTGGLNVNFGTLLLGTTSSIGSPTPIIMGGGTFNLNGLAGTVGSLSGATGLITGAANSALTVTQTSNQTYGGTIGGSVSLIQAGPNVLTLSGSNTYGGSTNIANGTLALGTLSGSTVGSIPSTANVVLGAGANNGIFQLGDSSNPVNQTLASLTTSGTGTSNAVVGGYGGASPSVLTLNIAGADAFSGQLGGGGTNNNNLSIVKAGTGVMTLSGSSTYTGTTNVSAGKLYVNAAFTGGGPISVANGATLGGTGSLSGNVTVSGGGIVEAGQGGIGSLTVGGLQFLGTGSVNIGTLSNYAGTAAINAGALSTTGSNSITINVAVASNAVIGTPYELLAYTGGAIGGTGFGAFSLGTLPSRATGTLTNTGSQIDLTVTGSDFLKWTGAGNLANGWDTSTSNWKLNSSGGATSFINGSDTVVFDDSAASSNTNVNMNSGNMNASSVTFNNSSNNYTFQGTYGIAGTTGLTLNGTGNVQFNNSNSYTGPTTLNGTGTLTLANSNSITGPIVVNAGVLNLQSNGALDSSVGVTIASGGVLQLQNGITVGTVPLNIIGSGTGAAGRDGALVNLGGSNSYSGLITLGGDATIAVDNGTLTLASASASAVNGAGYALTLTAANGATGTVAGAITGSGTLTTNGPGTWILTGTSTLSGITTINSGTLQLGDGTTGHDGALLNSSITNNGAVVFNTSSAQSDNGNAISGSGTLTKLGGGTLNLSAGSTYSGGTSLSAGTLSIAVGSNGGVGSVSSGPVGTGTLALNGGTLALANGIELDNNIYLGNASTNVISPAGNYSTLGGQISGPGGFILAGTLTHPGLTILNQANNFSGGVTINLNSYLRTTGSEILPSTTMVTDNGNLRMDAVGGSQTIGGLTGTGSVWQVAGTGGGSPENFSFNVGSGNITSTFNGSIGISGQYDGIALTKLGSGTFTLGGTNLYTGGTIASAGTLVFAAPGASPKYYGLTINSGAIAMAANHSTGVTASAKNNLFVNSLSIAGSNGAWTGTLDLGNNDLDVQQGNLLHITNQVAQGYNGGAWNSSGIVSSAAAADSTHLTALGVIQNSVDQNGGSALYSKFDGQSVSSDDTLVKYTYYGDANLDGKVDGSDYSLVDNTYQDEAFANGVATNLISGWYNGDFNYDGVVDGSDYTLMDNAFNTQGAQISAELATSSAQIVGTSAVPEPATLSLLGIGAVGLLGRRGGRRRSR